MYNKENSWCHMTITAASPSPRDGFLQRFRSSVRNGQARLLKTDADRDKAEIRRRNGRIDTVACLAGARARVGVMFPVPLEALGSYGQLFLTHPADTGRGGMWLLGPGVDAADPIDVVAACLADDPALLAGLVLPELAFHEILRDPAWPELRKAYHAACGVRACCDGLWCDLVIDLEAY